ncbi:MAG: O-antigen ligase family protein [Verrucomicrobia bacterium]|nr:O-antigen ligase family protein [Verrucomicrobiota bacterium]
MDAFAGSKICRALHLGLAPCARRPGSRTLALAACAALPVLCGLYPKWVFVGGRESLFLRPEDLVVLFLGLFALGQGRLRPTPIDSRVLCFFLVCGLSIIVGVSRGTLPRPVFSLLYLFRLLEYVVVGYVTLNIIRSDRDAAALVRSMVYATAATAVFGIVERIVPYTHDALGDAFYYRIYERGLYSRDANHVAALLVFGASITFGMAMLIREPWPCVGLYAVTGVALVAIVLTYSRGAYLATAAAGVLLIALSPSRWRTLVILVALGLVVLALAPDDVSRRLASIGSAWLGEDVSMSGRMTHYQLALQIFADYPLLGAGLASQPRVFYENFYMLLLADTGILGFSAFTLLVAGLVWAAIDLYRSASPPWIRGFAAGYLAGLLGLLVDGCAIVVFLLSRVATPFWYLSGILLWLHHAHRGDRGVSPRDA